ncbi:hypothetical protein SPRG_14023 [Saprolegnia parasitica CBS 223.65]|uniref:Elicitin n=1 Tax=Saprolegnia parasitica (strain CBS 223.65) TaxID=695850 RepID=A0A067C295_SAPPC|nr:hypothetical protein SPRG_14023 [Saprolegnia parasitica CBS 223.65]KDO20932.1 hypothetical protein SPRG_14023 [Saprolegnia parasitica CBS 223.65]|eukprot:XP_012208324.1 hypothetical protein SPRG_14023 [Saprolegnia parasitica CBS 223.65]
MPSRAVLVVVVACLGSSATATPCNLTTLSAAFDIMTASQCQYATNYTFLPPSAEPTSADVDAICAAPACQGLIPLLTTYVPSCVFGSVDFGAFAASVKARCGNGSTEVSHLTTTPPTAKLGSASSLPALSALTLLVATAALS